MREIVDTKKASHLLGTMSGGCARCVEGRKSVLFVTGVCPKDCFFCPLSEKRKNKDARWINERPVESDEDVIEEIGLCGSTGVGITGGEPLVRLERVIRYVKLLKSHFGDDFHIHLYTCADFADTRTLKKLKEVGLDEIRFHLFDGNADALEKAIELGFDVGVEVPVIPGDRDKLKKLVFDLDLKGVKFLNLNELEFSDTNSEAMIAKGLELNDDGFTAKDSKELAIEILGFAKETAKNLSVHFCTAETKHGFQYGSRLANRAKNMRKPFERVVEGMLEKGIVKGVSADNLKDELNLKDEEIVFRKDKNRVELSVDNARKAAKAGHEAAIVLEMPTWDCFDFELTPLDSEEKEVE